MKSVDDILEKLKRERVKFTGKRRKTVEFFVHHADKFAPTKTVFESVKETYPNVSLDTIYRTITTLSNHDIIEPMEFSDGATRYRLKCYDQHHHHLVCLSCKTTFPLDACPMPTMATQIDDFKVLNHRFEVYGYCRECQ